MRQGSKPLARREPRYIKPESIRTGDVIRVAWMSGDIERTVTAKVGYTETGNNYIVYYTETGNEILRRLPNSYQQFRITLLDRNAYDPTLTPLF